MEGNSFVKNSCGERSGGVFGVLPGHETGIEPVCAPRAPLPVWRGVVRIPRTEWRRSGGGARDTGRGKNQEWQTSVRFGPYSTVVMGGRFFLTASEGGQLLKWDFDVKTVTGLLRMEDGLGEDAFELVDVDGFGEVIVHAGVEALVAVFGQGLGGECDDAGAATG